ncbi:MAG: hypothetical protein ACE5KS_01095, partial [Woeseiaceae bacterium]
LRAHVRARARAARLGAGAGHVRKERPDGVLLERGARGTLRRRGLRDRDPQRALPGAHPGGLEEMEKAVLRELRRLIYRPRLEDGDVVPTENMTYTHEFFYRESDLPKVEEDQEPDAPAVEPDEEVAAASG